MSVRVGKISASAIMITGGQVPPFCVGRGKARDDMERGVVDAVGMLIDYDEDVGGGWRNQFSQLGYVNKIPIGLLILGNIGLASQGGVHGKAAHTLAVGRRDLVGRTFEDARSQIQ